MSYHGTPWRTCGSTQSYDCFGRVVVKMRIINRLCSLVSTTESTLSTSNSHIPGYNNCYLGRLTGLLQLTRAHLDHRSPLGISRFTEFSDRECSENLGPTCFECKFCYYYIHEWDISKTKEIGKPKICAIQRLIEQTLVSFCMKWDRRYSRKNGSIAIIFDPPNPLAVHDMHMHHAFLKKKSSVEIISLPRRG